MSESKKSSKSTKSKKAQADTSSAKTEEFKTTVNQLVDRVKNAVKEGNVRKIIVKNNEGKIVGEIPLNIAIFGALLAPYLAALGLFGSVLANYTIIIEKK